MWNHGYYSHGMDGFFGGWWGMFPFHGLIWLVLLLLIGAFVVALYRDWSHDDDGPPHTNDTTRHGSGHS